MFHEERILYFFATTLTCNSIPGVISTEIILIGFKNKYESKAEEERRYLLKQVNSPDFHVPNCSTKQIDIATFTIKGLHTRLTKRTS